MITLYFGNDKIKIVDAAVKTKKLAVNGLFSIDTPNDYLDNPNEKAFKEIAQSFNTGLRELGAEGNKVRVVLDNITIPFKEMVMPRLNPQKMLGLLKNEIFGDEKLFSSNTVDFVEAEKNVDGTKNTRLFVTYISNAIITDLQNYFKEMEYKLLSIDVCQNALVKLLRFISPSVSMPENYILLDYKETAITLYLISGGMHKYSMTKNIIAMPSLKFQNEMQYFTNEMTLTVKDTIKFFSSKYPDILIDTIYVTGYAEKFMLVADSISDRLGIKLQMLEKPNSVENADNEEFNEFSSALGGFLREGGK